MSFCWFCRAAAQLSIYPHHEVLHVLTRYRQRFLGVRDITSVKVEIVLGVDYSPIFRRPENPNALKSENTRTH